MPLCEIERIAMASRPVLYLDLMSQPCRAIETLCRMNNIDVERKWVSIGKRENQQPEFLAVNPLGKLPFLVVRGQAGSF